MTRQQMLLEFNRFSDDQLAKLITIGDSILSPMDAELTSVDFASMISQVFSENGLADRYFPEWTDRSKSDFGRFLVELAAIFSEKDFFYINHFSRESFIFTAEQYRSVYHKALEQGFKPESNVSAIGNVELIFSSGASEVVPRGSISLGVADVPELNYINKAFTIPESTIDKNVTAEFVHGKLRQEQLFFDGYSIAIDTANIVSKSISLRILNEDWVEVDSFHDGNQSFRHFMVFYDEEGKAEIVFAENLLGAKPEAGQLCDVEFIVGGGYIGDIEANTLNRIVENQTVRNLVSFTQFDMTGGNDQPTMEELRHIVIGKARTQNRVVIPRDVEDVVKELSFVEDATSEAVQFFNYVYVLTKDGDDVSESQKELVRQKVLPLLLDGFKLTVAPPLKVALEMEITIYLSSNTNRSGAEIIALQAVQEFLSPSGDNGFGVGVNRSLLQSKVLSRVTGSQNVVFDKLHRSALVEPVKDLTFIQRELVDVENSNIKINLIGGS